MNGRDNDKATLMGINLRRSRHRVGKVNFVVPQTRDCALNAY
jgi:hypothetical protein